MKILSVNETIEEVLKGKSISRFGDGEIELIIIYKTGINTGDYGPLCWKQPYSPELEKEMLSIITSETEKLLVASYPVFNKRNELIWKNNRPQSLNSAIKMQNYLFSIFYNFNHFPNILGNAFCFRDILEKEKEVRKENYHKLKNYFKGKKIGLLSSRKSDIDLDIFEESEVFIVDCPHNDAYSKINNLEEEILSVYEKEKIDLFLLSAGPTASCLAKRLSSKMQAIDAGQIIRWHWEKE